jgi:hypothetical protein
MRLLQSCANEVILTYEKDATATTYSLNCGNADSEDCGIPPVSD